MKIVFLDVDGVLNVENYVLEQCNNHPNGKMYAYEAQFHFDPAIMQRLKTLVERNDARIVISSTWRIYALKEWDNWLNGTPIRDPDWNHLIRNLEEHGLRERVIGVTPSIHSEDHEEHRTNGRGNEIKTWLRANKHLNIESIVILDDDSDMGDMVETHLAKCHYQTGLTEDVLGVAMRILNRSKFPKL